ncbi:hypothetical protein bthur0003_28450 [Bacillus thuringiensis serovar thuringiensis str. T01001]|nr:hypothetical protein H175_ch3112 [Bacillus thuringiensis serovar thuringiensis str. IS5056]EEM34628.1 hypothetical protein bthur0003_28450 [Bacillus thuringiensis serovar thuringiensis str. T01001]
MFFNSGQNISDYVREKILIELKEYFIILNYMFVSKNGI